MRSTRACRRLLPQLAYHRLDPISALVPTIRAEQLSAERRQCRRPGLLLDLARIAGKGTAGHGSLFPPAGDPRFSKLIVRFFRRVHRDVLGETGLFGHVMAVAMGK